MKISILDWTTVTSGDIDFRVFEEFGEVDCCPLCGNNDAAERISDADMVLCNKVLITEDVMDKCPDLKYIGLFATGYNNVDIEGAKKRGITVCNAGSYSTYAVAQQVFSYILHYCNKIADYDKLVRDGGWESSETFSKFPYRTVELLGKTLSVIGYGSIGKAVAKTGDALGMRVIVNTRTKPESCPYELVPAEEAFRQGDFVTVHCPLTAQTAHLINEKNLSLMKNSAVIINTSRGGVADEAALSSALKSGRIAAAYLDVLEKEPMSPDTPLKGLDNCVITPHTAWAPLETRLRLVDIVIDNIRAYLRGEPKNKVN